MFQTLSSSPSYDRSNGPPLGGHQLGQVKQLLLLFSGPFCFLDTGVQPLVPTDRNKARGEGLYFTLHKERFESLKKKSQTQETTINVCRRLINLMFLTHHTSLTQNSPSGFTLFGRLSVQQGGDTGPLVFPIFHYSCFEDLILNKLFFKKEQTSIN